MFAYLMSIVFWRMRIVFSFLARSRFHIRGLIWVWKSSLILYYLLTISFKAWSRFYNPHSISSMTLFSCLILDPDDHVFMFMAYLWIKSWSRILINSSFKQNFDFRLMMRLWYHAWPRFHFHGWPSNQSYSPVFLIHL